MGRDTFTRSAYTSASSRFVDTSGPATYRAEQRARKTGKLDELVDPAGYGVIRRSLLRFDELESGLFELTVGTSMPVETRLDTTGSMGGNVDVALKVLPDAYELCSRVLPGYDLHMATGIFGDKVDDFVLCRPQFEMLAEKIVEQLTLMVPERAGGDFPEDPHYGLFGGAYLTAAYINRIGLKGYDFTVSDAPARDRLSESQLKRIFGKEVFEKVAANGFQIDSDDLPTTKQVVQDLLKRAHAFFLQVGSEGETTRFWNEVFGRDRVIILPSTKLLPQVQAVIIGLTEGTLALDEAKDFLTSNNVSEADAERITRSVANIPIGVQATAENYNRRPVKGDLFRDKTDLWPIDPSEVPADVASDTTDTKEGPAWL
ncbi:MAG TPA: hypothetical protein VIM31_00345 [Candidatus Microsaccharimonas sp.]|jgi:hypothetical protein